MSDAKLAVSVVSSLAEPVVSDSFWIEEDTGTHPPTPALTGRHCSVSPQIVLLAGLHGIKHCFEPVLGSSQKRVPHSLSAVHGSPGPVVPGTTQKPLISFEFRRLHDNPAGQSGAVTTQGTLHIPPTHNPD